MFSLPHRAPHLVMTFGLIQMLKIIDLNFNLVGEIDQFVSFLPTRIWHSPGEMQLTIKGDVNEAAFQEDHLLIESNDPRKCWAITYAEYDLNEKGEEVYIVRGQSLGLWLSQRITIPPVGQSYDRMNTNVETIMKAFVDRQCVNPEDINRKIPNLVIAPDQQRGDIVVYQTRLKPLNEDLQKLSILSGLGWDITLDYENGQFVFDVYEGMDLREGQTNQIGRASCRERV